MIRDHSGVVRPQHVSCVRSAEDEPNRNNSFRNIIIVKAKKKVASTKPKNRALIYNRNGEDYYGGGGCGGHRVLFVCDGTHTNDALDRRRWLILLRLLINNKPSER
jgi:hypothetical protein